MNENKRASTPWVDPDDAPDLSQLNPAKGKWQVGEREINATEGFAAMASATRRGRPKATVTKQPVKLRLDADVLQALRQSGEGWQTRTNDMLRASLKLAGLLKNHTPP